MLEMGQPTHAFDYAQLAGRALRIRRAKAGEKICGRWTASTARSSPTCW